MELQREEIDKGGGRKAAWFLYSILFAVLYQSSFFSLFTYTRSEMCEGQSWGVILIVYLSKYDTMGLIGIL